MLPYLPLSVAASGSSQQCASKLLMVRPASFGWNAETSETNLFQVEHSSSSMIDPKAAAMTEFEGAVVALTSAGVAVLVIDDSASPLKPDAVFPNNWFSVDGSRVFLYPMLAPNRRLERSAASSPPFTSWMSEQGLSTDAALVDEFEHLGKFLEGTGSLVLDRVNRVAYAALSPRTDVDVVTRWASLTSYSVVSFPTLHPVHGREVYHTNVLMSVGQSVAILCDAVIPEPHRSSVKEALRASGKEIVLISVAQMDHFCGNALQARCAAGSCWIMSTTAYKHFASDQLTALGAPLVPVHIPTIETLGGGSARCMMAEIEF